MSPTCTQAGENPDGWMSNLGRAGGTRTHDPRIISLDSDMTFRSYECCYVPLFPGSTRRCVGSVPPGSGPCRTYPSRVPPTTGIGRADSVSPAPPCGGRINAAQRRDVLVRARGVAPLCSSPPLLRCRRRLTQEQKKLWGPRVCVGWTGEPSSVLVSWVGGARAVDRGSGDASAGLGACVAFAHLG